MEPFEQSFDPTDPPLCENCNQFPAAGAIAMHSGDGEPEFHFLCEHCLNVEPLMQMGAIVERMLGVRRDQSQNKMGPVSHPEPSEQTRAVLDDAMHLAVSNNRRFCDPLHLLGALLRSPEGCQALREVGIKDTDTLRQMFSHNIFDLSVPAPTTSVYTTGSPSVVAALRYATRYAAREREREVSLRHLVNGMLGNPNDEAAQLMQRFGASPQRPRVQSANQEGKGENATRALSAFARDVTRDAADGKIDPVIGREKEIEQVVEILGRRRKNNPVLIGEPGVGKTAIIEGLALRIVNGQVPTTIRDRQVFALDVAALTANSRMRGDFEARLKAVISEVLQSKGKIILFIDELHTIIGAGSAEGSMDAANMLKPALARGELQCAAATTLEEYRKIERDGALARRFQIVNVDEPDTEETIMILRGLKDGYETHHGLHYTDEAIVAAARLSDRHISEYFQPDKSIDLIDQAGARVRIRALSPTPEAQALSARLTAAQEEKEVALAQENYELASEIKKRVDTLNQELEALPLAVGENVIEVLEQDIAEVIARKTGIPIGDLLSDELSKLASLEEDLHERVIGQERAVTAVADAVRRARVGMAATDEPLGVFLFLGPTGVGKTELAKTLAVRIMGSEKALVRLDGSEYAHGHAVSKMVSAPPGYIGHGRGGELTEPVRRRPYSVVLIDEIDKMSPEAWNYLLQVMDDGRLTDGEGRTTDFRHTILILTSNIGAGKAGALGFAASNEAEQKSERLLAEAKRVLPPEFYNRIDEAIVFAPLTSDDAKVITLKLCRELTAKLLEERNLQLELSDQLVAALAEDGFDEHFGARPLRRHLRKTIEKALVDSIVARVIDRDQSVYADLDEEHQIKLVVTPIVADANVLAVASAPASSLAD